MVKIAYFYNNLQNVRLVKFSNPTAFYEGITVFYKLHLKTDFFR